MKTKVPNRWAAEVTLPITVITAAIFVGAVTDCQARTAQSWIKIYNDLNVVCRGGHGDEPNTNHACDMRNQASAALIELGYCYTGAFWRRCAKQSVVGAIRNYECGDNCYLTIVDARGKEHGGLCTAPLCQTWNKAAEMPKRFVGRKVRVTVTTGMRFYDDPKEDSTYDAFSKIELLQ